MHIFDHLSAIVRNYFRKSVNLANGNRLIVHFSYHKCMTSYFNNVFSHICKHFNWNHKHYDSDIELFYNDASAMQNISVLSVNNKLIDYGKIPNNYIGTHLIRDPRDLLVSGYSYHLWCAEEWTKVPMPILLKSRLRLKELNLCGTADGKSYQELLNYISEIDGYRVEMNFRELHFAQMLNWDFSNNRILELKYEEIFGNEIQAFKKIFTHYGFPDEIFEFCLKVVEEYSFKKLKEKRQTGLKKHAATGTPGQWRDRLPEIVKEEFDNRYKKLLERLGY